MSWDWPLTLSAVSAVATSAAAYAAFRAANASRAVVEDERQLRRSARLEQLHDALVDMQTLLGKEPVPADDFDDARRAVKRHALLVSRFILHADRLGFVEAPEHSTTGGRMIHPDRIAHLRWLTGEALRETEQQLEAHQRAEAGDSEPA